MSEMIRLDKFLADMSAGTRSQAKELISKGKVRLNGNIVKDASVKLNKNTDIVEIEGVKTKYCEYEYYMLNKPAGVVSATEDKNDRTVLDLLTTKARKDLFPVGRLDKDTEGLLIITNDGELSHMLLSPKKHVNKTYYVETDIYIDERMARLLENGVDIGDAKPTMRAGVKVINQKNNDKAFYDSEKNVSLITLTEGRFHQVKRMYQAVGAKVIYLKRISMGGLKLDERLKSGEYRPLTDEEIQLLKRCVKILREEINE
ncbi:MAG: rRNA pseudouridine synthase [Lachnospiraceae bacterium]